MKKVWSFILAATLVMGMAGCGGQQAASGSSSGAAASTGSSEAASTESTAASGDQIILKYAVGESPEASENEVNLNFARTIEENSGGRIKVEYYQSELGNDKQTLVAAMGGTLDIVKCSAGNLMDYSTALAFTDLPGMFKSAQHVRAAFEDEEVRNMVSQQIRDDLNMIPIAYSVDGGAARALFYNSANGLARVPEDMAGIKLRTTGSEIEMALFAQWGAAAVPMNFGELYLGLQQGTVEGMYGHPIGTYAGNLCEVTSYCTVPDISYIVSGYMMSPACVEKLGGEGSELYNIVVEAGRQLEQEKDSALAARLETVMQDIEAAGLEVCYPTEEEKELWRASGEAIWGDYVGEGKDASQELVDRVQEIGNAF